MKDKVLCPPSDSLRSAFLFTDKMIVQTHHNNPCHKETTLRTTVCPAQLKGKPVCYDTIKPMARVPGNGMTDVSDDESGLVTGLLGV